MITCRELIDALSDYLAGELAAERRAGLDGHLRRCPPCVALLESFRATVRLARRLPPLSVPPALLVRMQEELRQAPPPPA